MPAAPRVVVFTSPAEFARRFLPPVISGRAVELGCGRGEVSRMLARAGYAVDAVDRDPHPLQALRQAACDRGLPITIHPQTLEDFQLTIPDGTFDLVVAINLLHMVNRQGRFSFFPQLTHIIRMLKPGGRFICSIIKYLPAYEAAMRSARPSAADEGTQDALEAAYKPFFREVCYEPCRPFAGQLRAGEADKWICHWDLVADKL